MPDICHQANQTEAQHPNDVSSQLTEIASRGTRFALGAQRLALYEIVQANQDALEHARSGMNIAQEFVSKVAQAHSVKDLTAAFQNCGHEQMDRFHRSYEHFFTHGHEIFEASSGLVLAALRGEAATEPSDGPLAG
jgi:hypothetical protein